MAGKYPIEQRDMIALLGIMQDYDNIISGMIKL